MKLARMALPPLILLSVGCYGFMFKRCMHEGIVIGRQNTNAYVCRMVIRLRQGYTVFSEYMNAGECDQFQRGEIVLFYCNPKKPLDSNIGHITKK